MNLLTHFNSIPARLRLPGRKRLLVALAGVALFGAACVGQTGAYPIEVFSEMHYSQAYRSQETPRLPGVASAVVFNEQGTDNVLNVLPAKDANPYNPERGRRLFAVNCSVCHGLQGKGDGRAANHIKSSASAWATTHDGVPYKGPPNLQESRTRLDENAVFSIMTSGIVVMPRFGPLLSEAERWDIVRFIFDEENGLGR